MKEAKLKDSTRDAIDAATIKAVEARKPAGKFIGAGMDKCRICGQRARIVKTIKEEMENGNMLITRQINCAGKHRHTYPLKEVIAAKKQTKRE